MFIQQYISGTPYVVPGIMVDYDVNKPVYVVYNPNNSNATLSSLRTALIGSNMLILSGYDNSTYQSNVVLTTNAGWNASTSTPGVRRIAYTNIDDLKMCSTYDSNYSARISGSAAAPGYSGVDWSGWTIIQSVRDANNYNWNEGMMIIKGDEITEKARVRGSETTTKLHDTYTVGNSYEIYHRNENVQWDVFSNMKSYTGYDATKTQTLKNVNGTLTWVDDTQ